MERMPLRFEHKELLRKPLKDTALRISEYSFANLYLFRNAHQYEIVQDKELFISGITYEGLKYLMPTKELSAIDPAYLSDLLKSENSILFPIPEEWSRALLEKGYKRSFQQGDSDYLYSVEKISSLKGSALHGKRNLLKQFVTSYEHQALPLTKERMEDARRVLAEWQKESGQGEGETDFHPCREALDLYDELILCGGIYYAEGEPAGFVIGEEVGGGDTFALHFAKALKRFKGIYQFIFNNFAQILPKKYLYLNFEQDLGKPALRLAKSSYEPDILLAKYRVHP